MLTHRCNRFVVLLTGMRHYTTDQLLAVMHERRYPPLLRVPSLLLDAEGFSAGQSDQFALRILQRRSRQSIARRRCATPAPSNAVTRT